MIRKFHETKINNKNSMTVWSTGKPKREFLYSYDMAELANVNKEVVGFTGGIVYDQTKHDGTMRKHMDTGWLNRLIWNAPTVFFCKARNKLMPLI